MTAYVIEMSIGGTMRVKIEAESEEEAQMVAASYFIDDWENAGPLRIDDIRIDGIHPPSRHDTDLDASIIDAGEGSWNYAGDDPYGRSEEE